MSARARLFRFLSLVVAVASVFLAGCKSGSNNPLTNPLDFKKL